jgi:chromosome segregation ATPase
VVSTPATSVVPGVNPAQAQVPQGYDLSARIAQLEAQCVQYESRLRNLMSEKDKAINERNQAITQYTEMERKYNELHEQTQSSLTAASNSAQQAIDRAKQLERDMQQQQAKNAKLAALMQRPHLAPYESLIPEQADEEKLKAVLDQLEQVRQADIERNAPRQPAPLTPLQQVQQQQQQVSSTLQSLYGNRANINPAFLTQQPPIPASSPAQMNPAASSQDIVSAINQLYAEARAKGTQEAFEDATRRAALLANAQRPA